MQIMENETITVLPATSPFTNSTAVSYVDELPLWVHSFGFILYLIVLSLAIIVDTAILFVFWRVKELRNVTNNLLCNMVAADLLFALQTPMEGMAILKNYWELGDDLCRLHRFLIHTFYNVVILSLTALSIERYFAICQPMRFKSHEEKFKCGRLIFAVWIASLLLSLPQVFLSSTEISHGKLVCIEERPEHYLTVFFVYHLPMFTVLYFIPLVILIFTYTKVSKKLFDVVQRYQQRSRFDICGAVKIRRNIIRMLLVVVIVFVVCLTPLAVIELLHVTPVMKYYDPFGILIVCIDMLAVSHALLNPLVSSFMSKEFRKAAKKAFNCPQMFDLCKINHKEKNNHCKLQPVKQEGVNQSTVKPNDQTTKPGNDVKQDEGLVNNGVTLSFETLTETTELPKEGE